MRVLSINIGAARPVDPTRPCDTTGIFKEPVAGPVIVTRDGLPGDVIVSPRHHGGPDQAVYIYGGADSVDHESYAKAQRRQDKTRILCALGGFA